MNMSGTVVGDGPRWPGHHPSQETPSIAGTGTGGSQTFNSEGPSPLRSIEKETPERNPKKLRVVVRAVRLFNQRCPFLPKIKVSYAQIFARIRPSIAVSSSMLMVDTVDPHGSMAASYWDHVEAWHNIPWKVISKTGSHDIATKVDTQSQHSLISKTAAKSMGLKRLLLLHAIDLEGFAGGRERFVQYVQVELECALLGLSRVEGPMLVSTKIDGMIIGTNMNSKYELGRKILAAQDRYGLFPPGMSANSMARNNVIYPIYDDRKKAERKRDEAVNAQAAGERNFAISSMMQAKKSMSASTPAWGATRSSTNASAGSVWGTPTGWIPGTASVAGIASSHSSRTTTWNSTGSVFTSADDTASTVATSIESPSVFGDKNVKK